jgi:hypothetical protein
MKANLQDPSVVVRVREVEGALFADLPDYPQASPLPLRKWAVPRNLRKALGKLAGITSA